MLQPCVMSVVHPQGATEGTVTGGVTVAATEMVRACMNAFSHLTLSVS